MISLVMLVKRPATGHLLSPALLMTGDPYTAISGVMLFAVFSTVGLTIYFAPSIVARLRNKANVLAILALNLFLGWTLIGWVVALVWALKDEPPVQIV